MKPALLDVNVLIALIDPAHQFHDSSHDWFATKRRRGWATCPITENGCVRILSKPGYPSVGMTVSSVREILVEFCQASDHVFWPDSVSILDTERFNLTGAGPKMLTDLYLLSLASNRGGRLVTFDRNIRWHSVVGCHADDLEVLG